MSDVTMFDVTANGKKLIDKIVKMNDKLSLINNNLENIENYAELAVLYCQLSSMHEETNKLKDLCNIKMHKIQLLTRTPVLQKRHTTSQPIITQDNKSIDLPNYPRLNTTDHPNTNEVYTISQQENINLKSYEEIIEKYTKECAEYTHDAEVLLVWLPYDLAAQYLNERITEQVFIMNHRKKYTRLNVLKAIQEKWSSITKNIQLQCSNSSIISGMRQLRFLCWLLDYILPENMEIKECYKNIKQYFNLKDEDLLEHHQ